MMMNVKLLGNKVRTTTATAFASTNAGSADNFGFADTGTRRWSQARQQQQGTRAAALPAPFTVEELIVNLKNKTNECIRITHDRRGEFPGGVVTFRIGAGHARCEIRVRTLAPPPPSSSSSSSPAASSPAMVTTGAADDAAAATAVATTTGAAAASRVYSIGMCGEGEIYVNQRLSLNETLARVMRLLRAHLY